LSIRQGGDGPRIAIIGSGFSGICLGIQLKKADIHSFRIFEMADRLGGTWRDNTYPGAACDVPAFAYCFSFEQTRRSSPLASMPTPPCGGCVPGQGQRSRQRC